MPDAYHFDRGFIHTSRSTFTQAEFEADHPRKPREVVSCSTQIQKRCQCSASCLGQSLLKKFPFVRMLRGYRPREWLLSDLFAGISIAVVHIPQGMHVLCQINQNDIFLHLFTNLFRKDISRLFRISAAIAC